MYPGWSVLFLIPKSCFGIKFLSPQSHYYSILISTLIHWLPKEVSLFSTCSKAFIISAYLPNMYRIIKCPEHKKSIKFLEMGAWGHNGQARLYLYQPFGKLKILLSSRLAFTRLSPFCVRHLARVYQQGQDDHEQIKIAATIYFLLTSGNYYKQYEEVKLCSVGYLWTEKIG